MKKNIYQMLLLIATVIMTAACSSDNESVTPAANPGDVQTPIRITANYAGDNAQSSNTRVAYSEDGDNVSATWQSGDKLKVVFNGKVSTLDLESGVGETTATFSGSITGTPTATSMLICYVADQNNTSPVTINADGSYTYPDGIFLGQDGTLAGAAKCNLYYGSTFYGTGSDISCDFAVNTSLMKFTVYAPDGVSAGETATLTYKSNGTAISRATFTVGTSLTNTIYMTIPAGQYTGEQTLVYNETSNTLSATKATFVAGETYSKSLNFHSYPSAFYATADDYGKVVCNNGHLHPAKTAVTGDCTAVAVFAYISGNNRYAIALQNSEMSTWDAITNNGANKNTNCAVPGAWNVAAPSGASWVVATKEIYSGIFYGLGSTTEYNGGYAYNATSNAFITEGINGAALENYYWSTSEYSNYGWYFSNGTWDAATNKSWQIFVRPVLAF